MHDKRDYITKSNLKKEHGWTDLLIDTFLKEPDLTKPNPQYRSGPPMKLYKVGRVKDIEETNAFKDMMVVSQKKKASAQKAVQTKIDKAIEYANKVKVNVPRLTKEALIQSACEHFNAFKIEREDYEAKQASSNSSEIFLDRISVNYLRHQLTNYEQHLTKIHGKTGIELSYRIIKNKILDKISQVYPWLANECNRQRI